MIVDIQRIMAAQLHSSLTIEQALGSPLINDRMQACKRLGCPHCFEKAFGREYCNDTECRYLVQLEASRRKNARKKQRRAA